MTAVATANRAGTCRGCGRSFAFPSTGPARLYCADPECQRRVKARRSWKAYRQRLHRMTPRQGVFLDDRLQPSFDPPAYRGFSARFRDSDDAALLYEVMLARDPCSYCGAPSDGHMQPDHIVPFAAGGGGEWENLTGACLQCNSSKGDAPLLLWLITSPRLGQLRAARRQTVLFDLEAAAA